MTDSKYSAAFAGPTPDEAAALWSSHQQALTVGRLIERHHAQLRALVATDPSGGDPTRRNADAVSSYREDLGKILDILAALDAKLGVLDANISLAPL
jgi:hypothetical protein